MEYLITLILDELRAGRAVDDRALVRLTHAALRHAAAAGAPLDKRRLAKRQLLPYCRRVREEDPARWASWNVDPELERRLFSALRVKPRRTASGVATITVITKPWPCSGDCLFCPNDIRCPKSYLHDEPACERAEQNLYDPYLQVSARLTALTQMGHATDKVELIVLGGTWSDYPRAYQTWFMRELFRALNDGAVAGAGANPMLRGFPAGEGEGRGDAPRASRGADGRDVAAAGEGLGGGAPAPTGALPADIPPGVAERRAFYERVGLVPGAARSSELAAAQARIDAGELSYNAAFRQVYAGSAAWRAAAEMQVATMGELEREQRANERARHRVVGLVIETRPDAVTPESLALIRRMGCTKVQMGVQSTDQRVLDANDRGIRVERIERAFELLRAFGFKVHAHAMANLAGATPEADKRDYRRLMEDPAFKPDEVKLYPCALIEGARLCGLFRTGAWRPYTEDELLDVLAADVLATPAFCRISRMIRDFSSNDILAGNKKPNLRQLVEGRLRAEEPAGPVGEIRFREVGTGEVDVEGLKLSEVAYVTSNTRERFLQWVAPDGRIAGFCRLSLPDTAYVREHAGELPVRPGEAMIREVHVYGAAARLGEDGRAAQHLGLGRALVARAREIAAAEGYARVNVISAVGTREYYRSLGFTDAGLYQAIEAG